MLLLECCHCQETDTLNSLAIEPRSRRTTPCTLLVRPTNVIMQTKRGRISYDQPMPASRRHVHGSSFWSTYRRATLKHLAACFVRHKRACRRWKAGQAPSVRTTNVSLFSCDIMSLQAVSHPLCDHWQPGLRKHTGSSSHLDKAPVKIDNKQRARRRLSTRRMSVGAAQGMHTLLNLLIHDACTLQVMMQGRVTDTLRVDCSN